MHKIVIGLLNGYELARTKRQVTYDVSDREEYQDSDGNDYMLAASSNNVLTKKKIDMQFVCESAGMKLNILKSKF